MQFISLQAIWLLGFIKSHGNDCFARSDDTIHVLTDFTLQVDDGFHRGFMWEVIEPNRKAVRDYLGY